jgi:hypothetical protein
MFSRAFGGQLKLTVRGPGECLGLELQQMNKRRPSKSQKKPWTFAGSELVGLQRASGGVRQTMLCGPLNYLSDRSISRFIGEDVCSISVRCLRVHAGCVLARTG